MIRRNYRQLEALQKEEMLLLDWEFRSVGFARILFHAQFLSRCCGKHSLEQSPIILVGDGDCWTVFAQVQGLGTKIVYQLASAGVH